MVKTNEHFEKPRKRTPEELATIAELHKDDLARQSAEHEAQCKEREVQAQKRKEVSSG